MVEGVCVPGVEGALEVLLDARRRFEGRLQRGLQKDGGKLGVRFSRENQSTKAKPRDIRTRGMVVKIKGEDGVICNDTYRKSACAVD